MIFTAEEKLKAIQREIGYRLYVYPGRVTKGWPQEKADREIAIFDAIAEDYKQLAAKERLL